MNSYCGYSFNKNKIKAYEAGQLRNDMGRMLLYSQLHTVLDYCCAYVIRDVYDASHKYAICYSPSAPFIYASLEMSEYSSLRFIFANKTSLSRRSLTRRDHTIRSVVADGRGNILLCFSALRYFHLELPIMREYTSACLFLKPSILSCFILSLFVCLCTF